MGRAVWRWRAGGWVGGAVETITVYPAPAPESIKRWLEVGGCAGAMATKGRVPAASTWSIIFLDELERNSRADVTSGTGWETAWGSCPLRRAARCGLASAPRSTRSSRPEGTCQI